MKLKTVLLSALMVSILAIGTTWAETQTTPTAATKEPIKIGEINSYKALPLYTESYRRGWQLAVEEVNLAGGIHGRKIEVIDRDDQGKPEEAIRIAQELILNENIHFLSGCIFGNVCIALADVASKNKIPTMRWFANPESEGKRESNYAFGLNSLFVTARAPAQYALDHNPSLTRWASIAPNYAYGHQASKIFRDYLFKNNPQTFWSDTFWYTVGKLDASSTIGAIQIQKPEAVMNASFGSDVTQFIRMSVRRDFSAGKTIVSLETGIPEYLSTIGAECPEDWIMSGYPATEIQNPQHQEFVTRFYKKFGEAPGWMALNGYNAYQFIFAALRKSPSLKSDDLVKAMQGIEVETPIGLIEMRSLDHISTQGIWVGKSTVVDGKPKLRDWKYYSGDQFLIDEAKVKTNK